MRRVIQALLLAWSTNLFAAGPQAVALSDRALWPEPLDSAAAFDRASRAEMLVFSAAVAELSALETPELQLQLKVAQADRASIERVQARWTMLLLENWKIAAAACSAGEPFCGRTRGPGDFAEAGRLLEATLPEKYRAWYANARQFHRLYATELMRLAALQPRISSEIQIHSPIEHDGFEMADRHFLLSFDDGPDGSGGSTIPLLKQLDVSGLHAAFFVLGERLELRARQDAALVEAYRNQCVSMHGWEHRSHAGWERWQSSVTGTRDLVRRLVPGQYKPWFRPPYGQRRRDSAAFFGEQGLQVALWNIDSQDWSSRISGDDAAQRVQALMLLWRRGVILFHDVHPKALTAVPWLVSQNVQNGVVWQDCRRYLSD